MCMTMRGIKKPGSQTVTLARRGVFETDPALEERFFPHVGEIAMLMEKYIEMPRLNAVWNHPLYQKYYRENEKI